MKTLYCLLVVLAMTTGYVFAQDIYRVVDKDGNVIYTDQKPDDDAEPMDLPELNVLDADQDGLPFDQDAEDDAGALAFRFETPRDGDVIVASNGGVPVRLHIAIDVPATADLVVFFNGRPQEPIHALEFTLEDVPPGRHQLQAELRTPAGRVIAATEPVDFEVEPDHNQPQQ